MRRFQTPRLKVRDWRDDLGDAVRRRGLETALESILSARVLHHLPPPLQLSDCDRAIPDWVDARAGESDVMLIELTETATVIGLLLLASAGSEGEIHIGYIFGEDVWGRGFATELVAGLVASLEGTGPLRLVGGVGHGNRASARVLEKAGFERDPICSTDDTDMFAISIA